MRAEGRFQSRRHSNEPNKLQISQAGKGKVTEKQSVNFQAYKNQGGTSALSFHKRHSCGRISNSM